MYKNAKEFYNLRLEIDQLIQFNNSTNNQHTPKEWLNIIDRLLINLINFGVMTRKNRSTRYSLFSYT